MSGGGEGAAAGGAAGGAAARSADAAAARSADAAAARSADAAAMRGAEAAVTIDRLLAEAEQLPDPRARGLAKALAAAMIDMVGEGLRRIAVLGGPALVRALADDELVGSLLVLCDQHPDPPAIRAARALEAAGAALGAAGVALEGVDEILGGVRVRLGAAAGASGAPSQGARDRVRAMIEAIVVGRAPDVAAIEIELGGASLAPAGFVPLERLAARGRPA